MSRDFALVLATSLLLAAVVAMPSSVIADAPPGFYDGVLGLTSDTLRSGLHDLIDHHRKLRYSDIWGVLIEAHPHPVTPTLVLDIYRNHGYKPGSHTSGGADEPWNREHAWPKSHGFPDEDEGAPCNVPYTDAHLLFPADLGYNSSRQDAPYDECLGCEPRPVDGFPETPNRRSKAPQPEAWEVWPGRRGDIARAMFYVDVRYQGDTQGTVGRGGRPCREPDLILTDDRSKIHPTGIVTGTAFMGVLTTLIRWHFEDEVDDRERFRQEVIARPDWQGNRSSFVDRPDLVCAVWLGNASCRRFHAVLPMVWR